MSELYVGIDLGTTNSTISVIQTNERRLKNPIEKLQSIPILQYDKDFRQTYKNTLESYFYCKPEENKMYIGEWAKRMYSTGNKPLNTFTGIKTRIGGESLIKIPTENKSEGLILDMTQCSAVLLKKMRRTIEDKFNQNIDHLVVTVPAAFNSDERQATKDAIEMAGFKNFHILDEPAATLLYFINNGDGSLYENDIELNDKNILIYDIGGGTLDICIAHVEEDENCYEYDKMNVDIIARSKRADLGGNDFDQYLGAYFLSEFEKRTEKISSRSPEDQSKMIARVVSNAEQYKIKFNDKIKENIGSPRKLKKIIMTPEFELTEGQFVQGINLDKETIEEVYYNILKNTEEKNILRPIDESLSTAENLKKEDISMVILTGGMSNFYAIEDALKEYFGDNTPIIQVDTITSVSKGAAIDAYNYFDKNISLKKMDLKDRLSEDIFIRTTKGFERLISREDISKEKKGKFTYTITENNLISIPIFLFYGIDPEHTENFTPIAGKIVDLPRRYKINEKIDLNWIIDSDGVITIYMDGFNEKIEVNNGPREEILKRKKIIDELNID